MKISRRSFSFGGSALAFAGPSRSAQASAAIWQALKVGAGGNILGIDIANDGTRVINTDVGGAYIWSGEAWQQLITSQTMPSEQIPDASHINYLGGVWAINVCHGNSFVIYMLIGGNGNSGYFYKSTDKGAKWTKTSMPPISGGNFGANVAPYKGFQQKMIVDPANGLIICVSNSNGINVSLDGGDTWNINSTVPAPSSGWSAGLAFDPSGGIAKGSQMQTANVYLTSYGNGVWFSSTGISGAFERIADGSGLGGPTTVRCAQVDYNGVYYCADNQTNGVVWKWGAGKWTQIKKFTGNYARCVCVDPRQAYAGIATIAANNQGAQFLNETINAGSTFAYNWSGAGPGPTQVNTSAIGDVTWLNTAVAGNLPVNDMKIDPTTGTAYFVGGIGVWHAKIPTSQVNFTWQSQSIGIEELVANDIVAPGGTYGYPVPVFWDRPAFCLTNLSAYPASYMTGTAVATTLNFGGGADYASNDPTFICLRGYEAIIKPYDCSGYSTNGGQTWTLFPATPSPDDYGGCIAAATSQHMVCIVGNNKGIFETTDRGNTWTAISGLPTSGWIHSYASCSHVVAADRVNIGTFYAALQTGIAGSSGIYSNAAGSWKQVFFGNIAPAGGFNMRLRSVPGHAGHLFWTVGSVGGSAPASTFLSVSTKGGAAWTAISKTNGFAHNVEEAFDFGFGAAKPGSPYPAIYIAGWVDNVWGIWRCDNFNPGIPGVESWVNLGNLANNNPDLIKVVSGDLAVYGRCYVGFSGSGFAYCG